MCCSEAFCRAKLGALHRPRVNQFCALEAAAIKGSHRPTTMQCQTHVKRAEAWWLSWMMLCSPGKHNCQLVEAMCRWRTAGARHTWGVAWNEWRTRPLHVAEARHAKVQPRLKKIVLEPHCDTHALCWKSMQFGAKQGRLSLAETLATQGTLHADNNVQDTIEGVPVSDSLPTSKQLVAETESTAPCSFQAHCAIFKCLLLAYFAPRNLASSAPHSQSFHQACLLRLIPLRAIYALTMVPLCSLL